LAESVNENTLLCVYPRCRVLCVEESKMASVKKVTGLLNINDQRVAELRRRVEDLISLPEYYAVDAASIERGSTAPTEHH
jgi:hypothetical protein